MAARIKADAKQFMDSLLECQDKPSGVTKDQVHIRLVQGDEIPLQNIRKNIFLCERKIPEFEGESDNSCSLETSHQILEDPSAAALPTTKARGLLSWYVISQKDKPCVYPLWVRCDGSDLEGTMWMGAETICAVNDVTRVKLHNISSKGPVSKKAYVTVKELKRLHGKRHLQSAMSTRGFAQYNLFGSTEVENSIIESQSCVTVDFHWSNVESILQTPPLSSSAMLNMRVSSGDMRSPMYQLYKELEFVQVLADGLKTGVTEWLEPVESISPVELTASLIEDLKNKTQSVQIQPLDSGEESVERAVVNTLLAERGDLDFLELLWGKMRQSVASYQDIVDCLQLVTKALKYGDIKPWIHRDNSSTLSRLVVQSYSQQMEAVSFTGLSPVRMLLEMGLDKLRKDYINYLISQELTTLKGLSYYLSTEADLLEQVVRLRKLHHVLEVVVTCSTFLRLPHENLFVLTQSCLQYYESSLYDEDHVFQLQIRPAVISDFYQRDSPLVWMLEVCSGHGPKKVKTLWQLSHKAPAGCVKSDSAGYPLDTTADGDLDMPTYYITKAMCSLVNCI